MDIKLNLEICKKCWAKYYKDINPNTSEKQISYWTRKKMGLCEMRGRNGYLKSVKYVVCAKISKFVLNGKIFKEYCVPETFCPYKLEHIVSEDK